MKGEMCVNGTKGPTCQAAETNMTMPACSPSCGDSCACLLGRCVCGGEVIDEMDLSMGDMWKIVNCAAETVGKVKKGCKDDCMKDGATLQGCTECVVSKTKCLGGGIVDLVSLSKE